MEQVLRGLLLILLLLGIGRLPQLHQALIDLVGDGFVVILTLVLHLLMLVDLLLLLLTIVDGACKV